MENKHNMDMEDSDFFQGIKRKVMALRFENNLPPFVLLTHKKVPPKSNKKDKGLLNEGVKRVYLKYYKKLMKKVAPERIRKLATRDEPMQ